MARAISTLIGAAAYIGLAILGLGGVRLLFSNSALLTGVVVLLAMTMAGLLAPGGNLSPGVREDRGNRWVLTVFGILGLVGGWLPAFDDHRNILTIDGEAARWVGVVVFTLAGVLRLWPVYVLRDRFSGLVAIQPGHTLVTEGIYGRVRHPSYLGLVLTAVGWSLVFHSGLGVLLTVLLWPPLVARMNAEEKLLGEEFNGEYEAYRKRTSRLIPGVY